MQTVIRVIFASFLWILFLYISAYMFAYPSMSSRAVLLSEEPIDKTLFYSVIVLAILVLISGIILYYKKYPLKNNKGLFFKLLNHSLIGLVIIGMMSISLPGFIPAKNRAKLSSVKSNMYTIHTILEIYSSDNKDLYPENLMVLYIEANKKHYWKEINNPFTGRDGKDKSWLASVPKYINTKTGKVNNIEQGIVVYKPVINKSKITKYYLYGGSEIKDQLILDNGKIFYLTE